ncbi:MAG: hypothetical protein HQ521_10785 [Bacteroidetes bacterium]|nr:hypothetical protein [Bacteroidota bacterium]
MYRNTDYIYDAVVQLQQVADVTAEIESNRNEYDAVATINNTQFVVIGKPEIRTSNKGIVFNEIDSLKQLTKKPIIAIAKFIASDIAKELKEKGINYIDRAGNAFIKHGKLLIYITGQKPDKPTNFNQSRAFQESGIKLIFQLLTQPEDLQLSYRSLAEKTSIALGSVSVIMKELEDLRFVVKAKNKRYLKNKIELLERWTLAFNDVLRPRLLKKRFRFPRNENYNKWQDLPLDVLPGRNIWGGEPGASILTKQLQPQNFSIYTNEGWQNIASKFKLIPDTEGDVEILAIFWKEDENIAKKNIAPTLIILAELMGSGKERNMETAKIIIENELQHIK